MEDLEKYLKILNSERCLKKPKEAEIILGLITECFNQEKSQFTSGLLISLVLDENGSVFTFMEQTCGEFETLPSVMAAFKLLHHLVTNFQKCSEPYFPILFKKCLNLLDEKFAKIKEFSLNLIQDMIQSDSGHCLDVSELVSRLEIQLKGPGNVPKRVSESIFNLLGYLFQKFPESIKNEKWFFGKMFTTLKLESGRAKFTSVKGALEGINGYLTNYTLPDKDTLKSTYEHVKRWSTFQEDTTKTARIALNLLHNHWKHFSDLIYGDKEFWNVTIETWMRHKNTDREPAFKFLCSFYSVIAFYVKQNSNTSELNGYLKEFRSRLESSAEWWEKRAALVGIRLFVLTDSLSEDRFNETYELLAKFIGKLDTSKHLTYLPFCVECLAAFALKFADENFLTEQLVLLQRLSVRLIETYPSFDEEFRRNAGISLEKSFYNLGVSRLDVMRSHIGKVIHQGLIRTCSSATLAEMELLKETGRTPDAVCYKSYLGLWKYLLTLASTSNLPILGSFTLKKGVATNVFDAFIESFLKIVSKLNFGFASDLEVEKPSDVHIFSNIVDLYQDVIPSTDFYNLQKWLVDLFKTVICLSYKNPLAAGFYKIMAVNLKVADSIQFFEDGAQQKKNCFGMVEEFLKGILVKINQFKGDLQMACFGVLLAAPVVLVEGFAETAAPALEVIAQVARSSFPLLKDLMETLERWDFHLPPATSGVIMEKILPYFDIFFQSPYFQGNESVGYSKEGMKLKMEVVFNDSELLTLQKKFLIFLGHLDAKRGMSLIELPDAEERRNISDRQLVYSLPYNNGWVEMNLEEMMPRIVDLAESCGVRTTRLVACELLHSMVLLVLGNINQLSGGYTYLFRKVLRSCLKLGCDVDGLVCQLFEPLMFQIVHYFAGKQTVHVTETNDLIDLLLEHVTCQHNPTVRDFSAVLLRELTVWSIKLTPPEGLRPAQNNITFVILLQRIYSLALHPSYSNRLGAAVVFNKIYSVLREEEFVLNTYWFQLLYYFVHSLRMCDGPEDMTEFTEAIKHLERPLVEKHEQFNKESPDRIVPPEFKGGRLCHLVKWVMELAIEINTTTRHVAMGLFEKLAPVVNNCDANIHFVSKQLQNFLQLREATFQADYKEEGFIGWLKIQTAGFEYCTWLLEQRVLTTEEILQPTFKEVLKHFINCIMSHRDKQGVQLDRHKRESVFAVLMLLYAMRERAHSFPQEQWQILRAAIFKPSGFGFDLNDPSTFERLFKALTDLLKQLPIRAGFFEELNGDVVLPKFGDMIRTRCLSVENLEFLFALRVVEAAGFWEFFRNQVLFSVQEDRLVVPIFRNLFYSEGRAVYAAALEPSVKLYLEEILRIFLKVSTDLKVLEFLENEEEVQEEDTGKTVKKGEFFQFLFKNEIFNFLESKHELLLEWVLKQKDGKGAQLLVQILENLSGDSKLPHEILLRWVEFEKVKIENVGLKNKILLRLAVSVARAVGVPGCLKTSPVARRIYKILENRKLDEMEFTDMEAVFNLLPFLSEFGEGLDDNDRLRDCLSHVKIVLNAPQFEEALELRCALSPSQLNRVDFAFGEVFRCLRITRSLVIFNFILSRTPWVNAICKRKTVEECLNVFAEDGAPAGHALAALELAYQHCFSHQISYSALTVYELYLEPLIRALPSSTVTQLMIKNLDGLEKLMSTPWKEGENPNKILKDFFRKICAAQLLRTFFTKISAQEFEELPQKSKQLIEGITKKVFLLLKVPQPPMPLMKHYRKLMCELFNMICCIISAVCVKENFYKLFIFDERGNFLFRVIDNSVTYKLDMYFDDIPKRKTHLTMLRDAAARQENPTAQPVSYIQTNTLFSSSLQEDVTRFDFTTSLACPSGSLPPPSKNAQIELEMDAFNSHECMPTFVSTISKMVQDNIVPLDTVRGFPCWLNFFLSVLKNEKYPRNLKLFILKAMYNLQEYLAPFAGDIFAEFLQAILELFMDFRINYFLLDLIEMMVGWGHVPEDQSSQQAATELVILLLEQSHSHKREIISNNLEVLKTLIEVWKRGLLLSRLTDFVFKSLQNSMKMKDQINTYDSAIYMYVHVCGILLSNGIPIWNEDDAKEFVKLIVSGLQLINKHCELFGEVCGLALSLIEKTNPRVLGSLEKLVVLSITSLSKSWVQVLHKVHKNYPKLSLFFTSKILLFSAWESTDSLTVKKLEILAGHSADQLLPKKQVYAFITDMLNSPDAAVQELTLEIAGKLVNELDVKRLKVIMKEALRLQKSAYPGVRKQVYEISKKLYPKEGDEVIRMLCRVILLRGLSDGAKELEDSCLDFWREVFTATDFAVLEILKEMYTPETEDVFLSNIARVLLRLAGDDNNSQKKVFAHPIVLQCRFRKRNLVVGTRQSFLRSLASSGRTLTNQSVENLATIRREIVPYARPTPSSLAFEPTVENVEEVMAVAEVATPQATLPTNPFKRRFRKNEGQSYVYRGKKKRGAEREQKKEEGVMVYGEYRDGEYPDIQISHSQIIKLLEVLATRDPQIARLFLVSFYSGVIKTIGDDQRERFLSQTSKYFEDMLKSSETYNPGVFGFVLQVVLNHNENLDIDPHLISNASVSSNWTSLGALILEQTLARREENAEETVAKRSKGWEDPRERTWLDLAKLYRGLEEFDVLTGIFLDKLTVSPDAKEAIRCETLADWQDALQHYVSALQSDPDAGQKEFFTESYLSCLAKLSSWSSMNKCIRTTVDGDLDNLWENYYLLSWFVRSEMMIALGTDGNEFRAIFQEFCKSPAKRNVLSTNFGEEMTVFDWFSNNFQRANYRIDKLCLDFLTGWSHLDRWSYNLRAAKLASLQTLSELSFAARNLAEISRAQVEQNIKVGEQRWRKNVPGTGDDLTIWDVKLGYRRELVKRLKDFDLTVADVRSNLALAKAALGQNNLNLTKECLCRAKAKLPAGDFELTTEHDVCFNLGKMVVAKAKLKDPDAGLRVYLKVWDEISQQMSTALEASSSDSLLHSYNFILGRLVSEILPHVGTASPEIVSLMRDALSPEEDVLVNLKRKGSEYFSTAYWILEKANADPETKAKVLLELSKFLLKFPDSENFENLCENLLKSMALGSLEARELFGCVLNMTNLLPEGAPCEGLIAQADLVPSWMFLAWLNQMLAALNSKLYPFLRSVLLRLTKDYPNAIRYAVKVTEESKVESPCTKSFFVQLHAALPSDPLLDNFWTSMKFLAPPHLIIKHSLEEALEEAGQSEPDYLRINKIILDLKHLMFSIELRDFRGPIFEVWQKFRQPLDELLTALHDHEALRSKIKALLSSVVSTKAPSKRSPAVLMSYSPWLYNFHAMKVEGELELPGQYDGGRPPRNPVTIFLFRNDVLLFDTKCRPMRIGILGNDSKEHRFLIKFGEDLRQDERIQRVFQHFNQRLRESRHAGRLHVDTYKVIPLTQSLGMIQWLDNSVSLFEMLENSLGDDFDAIARAQTAHVASLGEGPPGGGRGTVAVHLRAFEVLERNRAVSNFRARVHSFPRDLLKRAFLDLSTSPQHFLHLRGNFATSHAVTCITHWLVGIGDRHLQNVLVSTKTGRVLGIDFGYAFGFATQFLTPPELLPFRLTPQILNLMRPLGESGWIKQTMIRCLRVFREESFRLRSVLEVFAEEPVMDWLKQTRKNPNCNAENLEEWYPRAKLSLVESKLNGANPVAPFEADLRAGHSQSDHLERFLEVLKGDPRYNIRARCNPGGLTEEEQVECLIDLATDPHVLGKTYVGWNPWL